MKKIFVLIFALHAICYAQTPCSQPIEGTEFNKHFDVLNRIQNDQDRLATAKDLFRNKCLSAKQLKIVCMIFNNERPRLNFALYAFDRVADKDEFYEVLDAFKLYSSAFKLYDVMKGGSIQNIDEPFVTPPSAITFPLFDGYNGPKGCTMPLSDNDFNVLTLNFKQQPNEANRMHEINAFVEKHCVSMAQLMKLSLMLQLESSRLQFLKKNFDKVYDMGSYPYASAVFNTGLYKSDWENYCSNKLAPPVPVLPTQPVAVPCSVSNEDFQAAKKSIQNESGNTVRLALTKQIISAKKCFTSLQIKELVAMMFYETGRMEIAKFGFDYAIDKSNYYQVAEALQYASSKTELMEFLKGK